MLEACVTTKMLDLYKIYKKNFLAPFLFYLLNNELQKT